MARNLALAFKNQDPQQPRARNKLEEKVGKERGIPLPARANDSLNFGNETSENFNQTLVKNAQLERKR